jgi:hypothetical protein
MKFDPEMTRRALLEYELAESRKDDLREAGKDRSLTGCGDGIYITCLDCCLVGMFDAARELLPKAQAFLKAAAEESEIPRRYFRGGTEASRLATLAMCRWLGEGMHDLQSLRESVAWRELSFSSQKQTDKTETQLVLAIYLDAGQYDVLFQRFAAAGLKIPTRLRQIQGEGTMSYAIARHRAGLEYTAEEVAAAIETFLKRHVPQWLSGGHSPAVARWMKIAFWKPGDDPIATLLRCYDYLPDLQPPKYP